MKQVVVALKLFAISVSQTFSLHSCNAIEPAPDGFPYVLPKEKPDRALSAAMERNYTAYLAPRPEHNELYSQFKYTELKGLDYNNHSSLDPYCFTDVRIDLFPQYY